MPNSQTGYLLGLGSNIDPFTKFPDIVTLLLKHFEHLHISRVLNIPPVGMNSPHFFLNAVVFIETTLSEAELKTICNQIETYLGRDRTDPDRKHKDRPADLDILAQLCFSDDKPVIANQITDEYFLYPLIEELSAYMLEQPLPGIQEGSLIENGKLAFGQSATTIYRDGHAR